MSLHLFIVHVHIHVSWDLQKEVHVNGSGFSKTSLYQIFFVTFMNFCAAVGRQLSGGSD